MSYDQTIESPAKENLERKPIRGKVIQIRDLRKKRDALLEEAKYGHCGCGSGKKAKFCCWDKLVQEARGK